MTELALDLQPIDWDTIEGAIYDWVVRISGCDAIWAEQNLARPAYPYLDLKRDSVTPIGGKPEVRYSTDLEKPNGQEIEVLSTKPTEFVLTVQAHVDEKVGANEPNRNALQIVTRLQASLGLVSVQQELSCAGLAVVEELFVADTSLEIKGRYVNRATMDVRLRTASVMTEQIGFIEKVEIESTELGIGPLVLDASA